MVARNISLKNTILLVLEGTGSEDSLHLDASSESLEEFEENSPGPWMPEEEEDDDEERKMEDEDDGGGESEEEEGCGDEHHVEADNENDGDQGGDHNEWLSKNQKILWSPNHEVARPYVPPPIPTPGPTLYAVARISSPETAFDLFFNEGIIQRILDMTNLQGRRSVNSWNTLTVEELRTYLGLLILAGIYKAKHEPTISLWDKESGRPIFSKTMAHGRFCQINRTISFDDRLLRPQRHHQNKMSPISDIWNMWNALLPKMYNLGREICIDEQLVSFSGRCSFRQYMPSKPAKYGLKIWTLCDVRTSYAWSMQMYTGKPPGGQREQDQEMRVVLDLCSPLEGHILTTDNFFTSFPLAAELKKKKMALVGTIRKNKAELPPHLVKVTGREVLSSLFAFSKDHTLVSYVPKKEKNFLILSTRHTEPEVMKTGKKKPKVIHDYNKTKGAVDHLDQACATYSCRRRAVSWPLCVFFHMVDISSYNAFVLFTEIYPDWNMKKSYKRRLFLEELGKALIRPEVLKREAPPSAEGLVEQAEQRPGPPSKRKQYDSGSETSEHESAEFSHNYQPDADDNTEEDSSDWEEEEETSDDAAEAVGQDQDPSGADHTVQSSKNKKVMWHPTNEVAGHYVPARIPTPGPRLYAVARISSPETAFALFVDEEILEKIVAMTNLQGLRTCADVQKTGTPSSSEVSAGVKEGGTTTTSTSLHGHGTHTTRLAIPGSTSRKRKRLSLNTDLSLEALLKRMDDADSARQAHDTAELSNLLQMQEEASERYKNLFRQQQATTQLLLKMMERLTRSPSSPLTQPASL
nr:piggyBac transposable element-derived protein 4-like [Nerophis lumbriciformis]